MNLDLYHAQIGEGNLIELVREALPHIGEIQVADVPGRCEPGTGEINYPAIAPALDDMGYDRRRRPGGLGPGGDPDAALDSSRRRSRRAPAGRNRATRLSYLSFSCESHYDVDHLEEPR